mmetsp:Transcript_28065/g.45525  ORF Transcript_28065/g.45525 Transcript_28065/m.45525 type:complete len:204 (+) Transcript_28065:730-1341(+)
MEGEEGIRGEGMGEMVRGERPSGEVEGEAPATRIRGPCLSSMGDTEDLLGEVAVVVMLLLFLAPKLKAAPDSVSSEIEGSRSRPLVLGEEIVCDGNGSFIGVRGDRGDFMASCTNAGALKLKAVEESTKSPARVMTHMCLNFEWGPKARPMRWKSVLRRFLHWDLILPPSSITICSRMSSASLSPVEIFSAASPIHLPCLDRR